MVWHVVKDDGMNIDHFVVFADGEEEAKNKVSINDKRVTAVELTENPNWICHAAR